MTRKSTEMARERCEKNRKLAEKRKKNGRKTAESRNFAFSNGGEGNEPGYYPELSTDFLDFGKICSFLRRKRRFSAPFYVFFSAIGSGYYYNNAVMGVTIEE